ncbi:MAG TPA: hypothetical protein VNE83_02755 [Terriglobales bacterium]|nr:hypothetical protein [Terriglobales bacterium]
MRGKIVPPTFEQAQRKLASLGFTCTLLSGGNVLARKYECAAILGPGAGGKSAEVAVAPGRVLDGELARLVDRGYQKFFKSADAEVPARPEELSALARFENELRYACGIPSLYNEALGSVSDRYIYDRIWFRDEGRQPKPWEQEAATALHA